MARYGNDFMRERGSLRGYDREMGGGRYMGMGGSQERGGRGWQGQPRGGEWGVGRDWGAAYDTDYRGMNRGTSGGYGGYGGGYGGGMMGSDRGQHMRGGYGADMDRGWMDRDAMNRGGIDRGGMNRGRMDRGGLDRGGYMGRGWGEERDMGDRLRSGWDDLKRNARDMFGRGGSGYDRGW